jgi:hypothetical protein
MSPDTIRRHNTMSLATIRLRRAVNLVAHTPDRARDRTIAAADRTRVAAAAVDRHPTGAVEVHRPTVAEAAIANHTQAPVRTTVNRSGMFVWKTE